MNIAQAGFAVNSADAVPSARMEERIEERIEQRLFSAAREWPSKTAVVDGAAKVSYEALVSYVMGLADELQRAGVHPGDRVAVFLDKTIEAVVALFAAWTSGAIAVPVNEGLKSRQVTHILEHSGARFLVSTSRALSRLDLDHSHGAQLIEPTLHALPQPRSFVMSTPAASDPAIILYTSGSTGLPKGILLSHENLQAGTRIVTQYLELQHDDRILSVLPFSFDYGLNQLLTTVHVGATLVLIRSRLPAEICRVLASEAITGCAGVPPFWIQLMSEISPFPTMNFPHLRYITNSGGAFPVGLVKQYRKSIPNTRIYLMYGLSEAFRSTFLPPEEIDRRPESMGRAIPETEVLVVDENGCICRPGEVGELVHRGPTVAMKYWNDPETTAQVFRPDTLPGGDPKRNVVFSGDLVKKDEEGFLYFVSRRDKMIKTLGYRVSPEEVEEILLSCPLVREAAVCGRPDLDRGAAIAAHVVPSRLQRFDREALVRYCRKEMPAYMQPQYFIVHDELPHTASGKIDRRGLE